MNLAVYQTYINSPVPATVQYSLYDSDAYTAIPLLLHPSQSRQNTQNTAHHCLQNKPSKFILRMKI